MTEREKKLRLRRKQAEDIIAWKKKLDDEELRVREIEKKANSVLTTKTTTTTAASSATTKSATTTSQTVSKIKQHHQQQQQQTMVSTSNEPPNACKKEEIPPLKSDQDESISRKNEETTTSRSQSLAQQEQPRIKTMSNNNTKSERTGDELKTALIKSQSQTTMKPVVEDTRAVVVVVVSPAKNIAMVENKTQCGPITTAAPFSSSSLSTTPLVASITSATTSPTVKELEMKVNELRSQLEMRRKIDEMEKLRKTLERAEKKEPTVINAYDLLIAKMKAALGNDDSSTSLIYDETTAPSPHNNSILQQQQQQPMKSCEPSNVFTNATTVVTTTYTTATLVQTPDVAIYRVEAVAEVPGEENYGETNLKPDDLVVSSNPNVESQDSKLGWC